MPETNLQKSILDYIEARGYYAVNVITASTSGVPDILACIAGTFVGIEVKLDYNSTSVLQDDDIGLIQESGGKTIIAYSIKDVSELIDELEDTTEELVISDLVYDSTAYIPIDED